MSTSQELPEENRAQVTALRDAVTVEVSSLLTDYDCMRFVRARKGDITKAATMASDWAAWWQTPFTEDALKDLTPSSILRTQEVDPTEEMYKELCPHAMYGFSKSGHPIYWEKTGIISNALKVLKTRTTVEGLVVRHIRLQEMNRSRLFYINNKLGKTNTMEEIEKNIIVFDLIELGMSPDMFGINYVKDMFGVDGNFYPERLHKMIMINAPWYFSAIWALVSFCVDPVTAEKITIVGADYADTLRELIDEDSIPSDMGGKAEVTWHAPYAEGSGCSPAELRAFLEHQEAEEKKKVDA